MDYDEKTIVNKIKDEFGDGIKEAKLEREHRINVSMEKEMLIEVASFIKHDLGFTIPNMCTGTDYKEYMEVMWHIGTPNGPTLIVLKLELDRDNPECQALTNIWKGMDWHERETYDLLGVNFVDHPDLRRLLMPENWEGHPLREDYVYKKPIYRKPEDFE